MSNKVVMFETRSGNGLELANLIPEGVSVRRLFDTFRQLLELMRQKNLRAYYRDCDFRGWTPRKQDTLSQWGITYEGFDSKNHPKLQTGDLLSFEDGRGNCRVFEVTDVS